MGLTLLCYLRRIDRYSVSRVGRMSSRDSRG
jgi:hypothetical protein